MSEGSDVTSTVRCVHALDIEKNDGIITVRISADGFLYNMVRIIVGTLCEVGFGRFTPDEVGHILALGDRKNAGPTAPPEGLYLNKVNY
jgi:tRNA pseudouridine38-40 synthase